MRSIGFLLWCVAVLASLLLWLLSVDRWETRPAENGQWRSCLTHSGWDGSVTSCSSPMTFDQAEWWTRTRGGKDIR